MKKLAYLTVLALFASPAFATHDWDNNPDMQQSILNDLSRGFMATGFSAGKLERGSGDLYGWVVYDVQAGDIGPATLPEKGPVDNYGSVIYDVQQ